MKQLHLAMRFDDAYFKGGIPRKEGVEAGCIHLSRGRGRHVEAFIESDFEEFYTSERLTLFAVRVVKCRVHLGVKVGAALKRLKVAWCVARWAPHRNECTALLVYLMSV